MSHQALGGTPFYGIKTGISYPITISSAYESKYLSKLRPKDTTLALVLGWCRTKSYKIITLQEI